jgi:olefin beta-lactone synthetase
VAVTKLNHSSSLLFNLHSRLDSVANTTAIVECKASNKQLFFSSTSFRDVYDLILLYAGGLEKLGISKKDRVLFLLPPSKDFLALVYAVLSTGAVPVFVDPGVGLDKLKKCIRTSRATILITATKGYILRAVAFSAFKDLKTTIFLSDGLLPRLLNFTTTRSLKSANASTSILKNGVTFSNEDDRGEEFIAFTSGATGTPKGVVYTTNNISSLLSILTKELKYQTGGVDLPLLPIFSLFNLALGITSIFPPMESGKPLNLDPKVILSLCNKYRISSSFGSPTLWYKIATYCNNNSIKLPHELKKIFIAGAPVGERVVASLDEVKLSTQEVFTPYGATEVLPVSLLNLDERTYQTKKAPLLADSGEEGVLIGKPLSGVEVKVIKSSSSPLLDINQVVECQSREIGEIIVKGEHVSPYYFNDKSATEHSKIADAANQTFWHRMGDLGYCDKEGNLYFCGRKAHEVVIPNDSEKIYRSIPVELIFNRDLRVARSALIKFEKPNGNICVGVAIEPTFRAFPSNRQQRHQFISELKSLAKSNQITASIEDFFFFRSFPVDGRHNAKIFRCELGKLAAKEYAKSI